MHNKMLQNALFTPSVVVNTQNNIEIANQSDYLKL